MYLYLVLRLCICEAFSLPAHTSSPTKLDAIILCIYSGNVLSLS